MTYAVKELYYTLQGEGFHTGRPAVFLRFAGCNLWSGHEADRPSAICPFCDTDFVGTDGHLLAELHAAGFEVAVETNGTLPVPDGVDWLTVSPKAGAPLTLQSGDELKLVYPQEGAEPERFGQLAFRHFYLQPLDGPERESNTRLTVRYCLDHPQWRLSLQTQKYLGIP
jgi:organic radical activating enzyme